MSQSRQMTSVIKWMELNNSFYEDCFGIKSHYIDADELASEMTSLPAKQIIPTILMQNEQLDNPLHYIFSKQLFAKDKIAYNDRSFIMRRSNIRQSYIQSGFIHEEYSAQFIEIHPKDSKQRADAKDRARSYMIDTITRLRTTSCVVHNNKEGKKAFIRAESKRLTQLLITYFNEDEDRLTLLLTAKDSDTYTPLHYASHLKQFNHSQKKISRKFC
jgi:hypothetical protein